LRNLVSNAIKYTMGGGKVSLTLHDRGSRAEVGVVDSGIGMSPEKLATLFHLDKAHSAKGTANEPGTGLGLILCKEFVEKNGGNFTVLSEPGSGSTFIFTLPKS
jgi:signal transduction histidine kinase